jgi:hypothetical protein
MVRVRMNPFTRLASLPTPPSGFAGAEGVMPLPLVDATAIVSAEPGNTARAGQDSMQPIQEAQSKREMILNARH